MSLPTLDEVIEIIKAGDKKRGRELLANVIQADLENEKAWLWMSGLTESDEERRKYLNRVLEINPDNQAAKRGLAKLNKSQAGTSDQPDSVPEESFEKADRSLSARLAALQQEQPDQPESLVTQRDDTPVSRAEPSAESSPPEEVAPPSLELVSQSEVPETAPSEIVNSSHPEQFEASEAGPLPSTTVPSSPTDEPSAESQPEQAEPPEDEEAVPAEEPFLPEKENKSLEDEEVEAASPIEDEAIPASRQVISALPAPIQRLINYWGTERGELVIGVVSVGLLLTCAACVVCGMVFGPVSGEIPPTLAALAGTDTPTATLTPIPPTQTPTPTITSTPTHTPTPTPTPTNTQVVFDTPTVTATPSDKTFTLIPAPQVVVAAVNDLQEYVDIENIGGAPQSLVGWRLVSELDGQECILTGIIQPGQSLRVWALFTNANQEGLNCGFDQNIWSDTESDTAVLYNARGVEVSRLD